MLINIFKDDHFKKYSDVSSKLISASNLLKFTQEGQEYDLPNDVISRWFDPKEIKCMPASRSYPDCTKEQLGKEYDLVLYQANYLALFLIPLLYSDRKDVLIQDIGAGIGHLLAYLKHDDFNNFLIKENFSQCSKHSLDIIANHLNFSYQLNDDKALFIIQNNSGVPEPSIFTFPESVELTISYTNRNIEKWAETYWKEKDFVFLCKDLHDHAFAYCRKDKLEEFQSKLKPYEY